MTEEAEGRQALSQGRLERARQHLKSARDLLAQQDLADSVSRSYYGIFQAARALLALEGLDSRKHSGIVALFNRHFVKTGRFEKRFGTLLKTARQARERADYGDLVEFAEADAESQLREAEEFVRVVEDFTRQMRESD
jgi:uncharacterized protein (UPF0332 family)